jgi:hypothetical protein
MFAAQQQMIDGTLGGRIRSAAPARPSPTPLGVHKTLAMPSSGLLVIVGAKSSFDLDGTNSTDVVLDSGIKTPGIDTYVILDTSTGVFTVEVDCWIRWDGYVQFPVGAGDSGDGYVRFVEGGSAVTGGGNDGSKLNEAGLAAYNCSTTGSYPAGDTMALRAFQNSGTYFSGCYGQMSATIINPTTDFETF